MTQNINISFELSDLKSTKNLAILLGHTIDAGTCILLEGDLGAGKTTFSRYFIANITDEDVEVVSPTFTLVQTYTTLKGELSHFDLYRLEHCEELVELGFLETVHQEITLIEWPDRLGHFKPDDYIKLDIQFLPNNENGRNVIISLHGACCVYSDFLRKGLLS